MSSHATDLAVYAKFSSKPHWNWMQEKPQKCTGTLRGATQVRLKQETKTNDPDGIKQNKDDIKIK